MSPSFTCNIRLFEFYAFPYILAGDVYALSWYTGDIGKQVNPYTYQLFSSVYIMEHIVACY